MVREMSPPSENVRDFRALVGILSSFVILAREDGRREPLDVCERESRRARRSSASDVDARAPAAAMTSATVESRVVLRPIRRRVFRRVFVDDGESGARLC